MAANVEFDANSRAAKYRFKELQAMLETGGEIKLIFNSKGVMSKQ